MKFEINNPSSNIFPFNGSRLISCLEDKIEPIIHTIPFGLPESAITDFWLQYSIFRQLRSIWLTHSSVHNLARARGAVLKQLSPLGSCLRPELLKLYGTCLEDLIQHFICSLL